MVNMGSIPVGPSHGEVCLLIHPGDRLRSGPKARSILRSGLNLEGMAEQSTELLDSNLQSLRRADNQDEEKYGRLKSKKKFRIAQPPFQIQA